MDSTESAIVSVFDNKTVKITLQTLKTMLDIRDAYKNIIDIAEAVKKANKLAKDAKEIGDLAETLIQEAKAIAKQKELQQELLKEKKIIQAMYHSSDLLDDGASIYLDIETLQTLINK